VMLKSSISIFAVELTLTPKENVKQRIQEPKIN